MPCAPAAWCASEILALLAVGARPEVVSLAGGMPYISALPLDVVGETAGQLVADRGAVALQYGSGQGDPGLREGSNTNLDQVQGIYMAPGTVSLPSRSPGSPWPEPYCRATAPRSATSWPAISPTTSSGSAEMYGMPPASDTTSGRAATANSARISACDQASGVREERSR